MPIYSYRCADCGAVEDQYSRVSERDSNIPTCHGPMARQLCPSMVSVQADVCGASPIDGTPITSRRQRTEYMKRNGLEEATPAAEVIRDTDKRVQATKDAAKLLPRLPKDLEKQLYQDAGFPG